MRKIFALGSVALALCATGDPAAAADAALPPLPPQFNWTGFFGGGHLGYAGGRARWAATEPGAGTTSLAGAFDLFDAFDAFKGTGSYFLGLGGGYNTMLASRVVLGVEADVSFPSTIRGLQTISPAAWPGPMINSPARSLSAHRREACRVRGTRSRCSMCRASASRRAPAPNSRCPRTWQRGSDTSIPGWGPAALRCPLPGR